MLYAFGTWYLESGYILVTAIAGFVGIYSGRINKNGDSRGTLLFFSAIFFCTFLAALALYGRLQGVNIQ